MRPDPRPRWQTFVVALLAMLASACSESRTGDTGNPPERGSPTTSPARSPRPEDSATPGPLPRPGAPSTATENPTGTGTGR
jgi:hypothetical protein